MKVKFLLTLVFFLCLFSSAVFVSAEETTTVPSTTSDFEYEEYDGYGLLQPIGEFIEGLRDDFKDFKKTADNSAKAIKDNFSPFSTFLTDLMGGLPVIIGALISFCLIFFVIRKVVGR